MKYGIAVNSPGQEQYGELRYFIEAVKQNRIDEESEERFCAFVNGFREENVILGCTELPLLYSACLKHKCEFRKEIYDPLQSAINVLLTL